MTGRSTTKPVVIGHVEWSQLIAANDFPATGQIVESSRWDQFPAGGACVAAVQLAKLAGGCDFFTAVGADEWGSRSVRELERLAVTVHAAQRDAPTRKALVLTQPENERTIIVHGERHFPRHDDPLPWDLLSSADCALVTAADDGVLRAARGAGVLILTARALVDPLPIDVDAVVGSATDTAETLAPDLLDRVGLVVRTRGRDGGTFTSRDGSTGAFRAPPLAAPVVDTYGAGDSFAAGLTFALTRGLSDRDAVDFAARCGAAVLAAAGPYEAQLTASAFTPS
ncbi:MAG TPA: PfkB family carbohydrate kinase [Actinomycetota bacterium]|nr:PfkB family carbohydrate kinase [Actinomycetota bacterium]